jgi:hypothetical protein
MSGRLPTVSQKLDCLGPEFTLDCDGSSFTQSDFANCMSAAQSPNLYLGDHAKRLSTM